MNFPESRSKSEERKNIPLLGENRNLTPPGVAEGGKIKLLTGLAQLCYVVYMSAIMQAEVMADFRLRDIPDPIFRQLKAQAALAGLSLNAFLLQLLAEHVDKKRLGD